MTAACSANKKVVVYKKKPLYKRPKVQETEIKSPATPLVTEGIAKLKDDKSSEAEWKFEEAINLDPDYGPAYYWLARARYRLEEIQKALDMLDKAKALLKNSDIWLQRIEKFRNFLLEKIE